MNTEQAISLLRNALTMSLELAGPLVLTALVAGVIVGIVQTATQINEASISYVVKLIALVGLLLVLGPTLVSNMVDYTRRTYAGIAEVVR
jgi:flagellar biosynthetic protein FliQ